MSISMYFSMVYKNKKVQVGKDQEKAKVQVGKDQEKAISTKGKSHGPERLEMVSKTC